MAVVCGLVVVGCGSSDSSGKDDSGKTAASEKVGQCPAGSLAVQQARTMATVDVDGDGRADAVRLTGADNDCPNVLFAKVAGGYLSAQLPVGAPLVTSVVGVDLEGRDGALVVTRQDHPRGGFQLRVFATGPDGLAELKSEGQPLVPFVATDVREQPLSVDCQGARVVVTEATAHSPAGVVPAWDVRQTAYSIDGSEVTNADVKEIADNVLDKQLGKRYPALTKYAVFPSCRS